MNGANGFVVLGAPSHGVLGTIQHHERCCHGPSPPRYRPQLLGTICKDADFSQTTLPPPWEGCAPLPASRCAV